MRYPFQDRIDFSRGEREKTDIQTLESMIDGCMSVRKTDLSTDKDGIDYIATLRGGAELTIDAKTREKGCSRYWSDRTAELALEEWSVVPTENKDGVVGWTLCETKELDMVFFKFHPDDCKTGYLFSYDHLRMAFRRQCEKWKSKFKTGTQTTTHNGRKWKSRCVFVPVPTVETAIRQVRRTEIMTDNDPCPVTQDLFDK